MSPVEIFAFLLITVILAAAASIAPSGKPLAVPDTVQLLQSKLNDINALRLNTGNGATLVVAPSGSGSTLTEYAGRPNGGTFTVRAGPFQTEAPLAVGATTSFALMVDSEGELVEVPFTTGSTTTSWPSCTTLTVVAGSGTDTQDVTLSCSQTGQG